LHHRQIDKTRTQVSAWPLKNIQLPLPTDVAFGFLTPHRLFPYLSFTLSPAAPRLNDTVFCVGYSDSQFPEGGIPLQQIKDGSFDWQGKFSHSFHVTEGKVKALFIHHFSRGYADGPCFLIDCELEHGQSGGPVFNSAGNICGINLGGASILTGEPSSLASLIYPTLAIKIKLTLELGEAFGFTSYQPLINLIHNGVINTDGSEHLARFYLDGEEYRIDPLIHRDDAYKTFQDFHGYRNSTPATPEAK
jgi:hypothetical protein